MGDRRLVSAAVGILTVLSGGCASGPPLRRFTENIIEGRQFAHYIHFPASIDATERHWYGTYTFSAIFGDTHVFETAGGDPNLLLVTAHSIGAQYPATFFSIDALAGYSVRQVSSGDWAHGASTDPDQSMYLLFDRGLRKTAEGFEFEGHRYPMRRGVPEYRSLMTSADGRLIVVQSRARPDRGTPATYYVDIFDARSGTRLASLDLHCRIPDVLGYSLEQLRLVNSRWFAVGLDEALQEMLLFDFRPHLEGLDAR